MNRDQFVEKLKAQLDEINADIDQLEARLDSAEAGLKAKYKEQLAEAKANREKAEAKLGEIIAAGDDAWDDLREEAEHTWKALRNSVNYFKSHFK